MKNTLQLVLKGAPRTKKNSQRLVVQGPRWMIIPSAAYRDYEAAAGYQITCKGLRIDYAVNVKCIYYMPTRRRVDLVNLLEATCDILVKYGVIADDNSNIVASHDGSRVCYDKENPRVEITIEEIQTDAERDI